MQEQEIGARLARLERSARRQRRTSIALGLALVLTIGHLARGGAARAEPVRATGFELLDAGGQVRAGLEVRDAGARLFLTAADGTPVTSLFADEDGGGRFELHGSDGAPRVELGVEGGAGRVTVSGPADQSAALAPQ